MWASKAASVTAASVSRVLSASMLGGVLFPQNAAESTAPVTPTDYAVADKPLIDVRRYGAVLDGATDDSAAIAEAIAVAAVVGGRVLIPGAAAVASANLPIALPSGAELVGLGRDASSITVTGSAEADLFTALNRSGIRLADLSLVGNDVSTAYASGVAFKFEQDGSATAAGGDVVIERCTFSNFRGDFWLYFRNSSSTYELRGVWVSRCRFLSQAGNARGPASLAVPDAFVAFEGQADGAVGLVSDAWVSENYFEASHKKMCGIAWHSTRRIHFVRNQALNCGAVGISDNCGAYAFMAYENSAASGGPGGARPDLIFCDENLIISPRSCGLYVADGNRIFARGNVITGQTDDQNATLPKGAIAINDATHAEVIGNWIEGCYAGISAVGSTSATAYALIRDNTVRDMTANGFGVLVRATYVGSVRGFEVIGNSVEGAAASSRALWIMATATQGIARLIVKDNSILSAPFSCCELYADDASVPAIGYAEIAGNVLQGDSTLVGLSWTNAQNASTRALIARNRFIGSWDATNGRMLDIRDSYGLTVADNEFNDMTAGSGYALRTGGARGRFRGCLFNNVASARMIEASGVEDLGYDAPTWSGSRGDYVQVLAETLDGNSMLLVGYQHDGTAWRAQRISSVSPAT